MIDASNVTVKNVHVVTNAVFGISLTHTTGVTIENSTISGQNATKGRVNSAIDDVYGDSTGMVIKGNNISLFRTAVQISTGVVNGNYIHDPGYLAGDHTNGFYTNGGTEPLTIENNTILISLTQTDTINLDAGTSGVPVANKTVENNFLAGGGYSIYGGTSPANPTSHILIEGNRFGQQYYPRGGQTTVPSPTSPPPGRATPGRATSGTPPGRPSPPRDRRTPDNAARRRRRPANSGPVTPVLRGAGDRRRCGPRRRPLASPRHVKCADRRGEFRQGSAVSRGVPPARRPDRSWLRPARPP